MAMHLNIIKDVILYINNVSTRFVLKGGTALMLFYNLGRFSEDVDMDSLDKNFIKIVSRYVKERGYGIRVGENTELVKRVFIDYGGIKKLKVEVSYRRSRIWQNEYVNIDGINVYSVQRLLAMKLHAFSSRSKIRDLYDICHIGLNYSQYIQGELYYILESTLAQEGLEKCDYLLNTQNDPLIDKNQLSDGVLELFGKLGLL